METKKKTGEKFSQSFTFKGITIVILILLLLIPNAMIRDLIHEREQRSDETILKINEKWSLPQTVCGPILTIPYTTTFTDADKKTHVQGHELHITPKELNIHTRLFPEERHYGIYKSILYKSEISVSGQFAPLDYLKTIDGVFDLKKAYLEIGLSDLRGVTKQLEFKIKEHSYPTEVGSNTHKWRKNLAAALNGVIKMDSTESYSFECQLNLNGSSNIGFIPVGNTTKVTIEGDWKAPGFIGSFTPDYKLTEKGFQASWSILNFNRNIPEYWIDNTVDNFEDTSFGVILVETVDHYQQNMRSAKYALMFIALTFAVFFFVEILTQKRIHPIQYLLVGLALILFYSLLLSISEQTNFAFAYLIAAVATIALITAYAHSIFKNKSQTGILLAILTVLYVFLYVILQLEDVALLIGSIGLFIILGIIMFISGKIKWYKPEPEITIIEEEKPQ
ncbi:MAG: cell envelope integrity protein CreD [Dysgonamonadaceae bacterium]|jgi:inner membrane protein|nr:cell envelope integrity protein CreD [Dysgonamonadaceae bacterium]